MNILLLGCSYSAGSWEYTKKFLKEKKQDYFTDMCKEILIPKSPRGYCFLNTPKGHKIEAHSFMGCGYSTYAQFLYSMEKRGKLKNFDRIIIQESWEPRTTFVPSYTFEEEYDMYYNYHQKNFEYNQSIKINVWNLHPSNQKDNKVLNLLLPSVRDKHKHESSILHEWIFEKSLEKVKEIIQKNSIKCTVISMSRNFLKTEGYVTNIGFNLIYKKLKEKNIIADEIGHLTIKGNKLLAQWLNEYKILENI